MSHELIQVNVRSRDTPPLGSLGQAGSTDSADIRLSMFSRECAEFHNIS